MSADRALHEVYKMKGSHSSIKSSVIKQKFDGGSPPFYSRNRL